MEQSWFAMAVGAGLIFGFLIAWISMRSDRASIYTRGRADAEKERVSLEERILAKDARLQELQVSTQREREALEGLRDENANLRATHAEYDSRVSEIRRQADERIALVNESQHRLVETLRDTMSEKALEQEARVKAVEADLEAARRENEVLCGSVAAAAAHATVHTESEYARLLSERELQLASVLAEALQMRKQIESLEVEKATWIAQAAGPSNSGSNLLAERERQLTAVLGEALQLRQRVDALEAEKVQSARTRVAAVAPEMLAEREAQLAAALSDALAARQRLEGVEAEKAAAVEQLTAAFAEAHAAQDRVKALEAERALGVMPDLLAEREAQLAAALPTPTTPNSTWNAWKPRRPPPSSS